MQGIKILGTGSYIPPKVVTNNDFAEYIETSDEWIRSRTGIGERHISDDKSNVQMAVEAANKAIADSGVSPEEIDLVIVSTCTPDYFYPSMSCMIQAETGAVNAEYKYEPANHSEEALELFIKNLRPIVEYAEKMGVIVAIEPVYKHIVCNLKRAKKVLEAIDSPNLQIIFDPVNLLYTGNLDKQDEIIEEAFDLLNDDIAVIHCKDYKVDEEKNELVSIPSGQGGFNYPLLMKKIKEYKPYVHISLENTKPENAIATREFLEKLYAQA